MPEEAFVREEVVAYAGVVGGVAAAPVVEQIVGTAAVALQGPPGPPGNTGPAGTVGSQRAEDFEIVDPVAEEVVLLDEPVAGTAALYVNGLRQRSDAFSIAGQTVTLPAELELMAGDLVTVEYVYEV